jgi:hypothetical protein
LASVVQVRAISEYIDFNFSLTSSIRAWSAQSFALFLHSVTSIMEHTYNHKEPATDLGTLR